MTDDTRDPIEAITAALGRLRGRRGPRPGWDGGGGQPRDAHAGHARRGHGRGTHGPGGGGGDAMAARLAGAARFRLLEVLAAAPAPLSVSALAEAIGVDQPRASRLVQQAVDARHVRREADPDDARRTLIALTDEGRALFRGFRGERRAAVASALEGFTENERVQLAALLTRLADAWPRG
ncbi:MarR family transcriptional regulator [Microbacterium sp. LRZ72]|uniref:MarR family winged helix-turn-helix transcriptional regulator n=1 Tax=Microbacterium sp. LRZ72 TaxID=2942481 RepID=UPI0029BE1F43|nr:MarR family transcriptional regulator [Microbacterium sp. LRZ72]MDX2377970.1 MarR family transcriptional regulator [Microbacterium sp. LRZ72]